MASLGSGTIQSPPTLLTTTAYTPYDGDSIGSGSLVDLSGGGGSSVDPKRAVKVGGVWVPIQ